MTGILGLAFNKPFGNRNELLESTTGRRESNRDELRQESKIRGAEFFSK
jgi:hypothetical protein